MYALKVEKFGGQVPAWTPRILPDDQASYSLNTYLYSGSISGWRLPKILRTLNNSAAKFAYRIPTITSAVALANLVFIGNPNEDDTVQIGEIIYRLTASPSEQYDVLLGGNAVQTCQSLFMAVTGLTDDPSFFNTVASSVAARTVQQNTTYNQSLTPLAPVIGNPYAFISEQNAPGANTVFLVPITPQSTIEINQISAMPAATNGVAKFKAVVYSNVNQIDQTGTTYINIPTSVLSEGTEVIGCNFGVPIVSSLPLPITLQGGFTYWIGFITDTAVNLAVQSGATNSVSSTNTYASGPPNPFQTPELTGVTTAGTTVGSLLSNYNQNQPNWQVWASTALINSSDPENSIGFAILNGSSYPYLQVKAPSLGASFNNIPVAESSNRTRMTWLSDLASFNDTTNTLAGGENQTSDTTITGLSTWLEFLDQDTNVIRTPVVDDTFQRYYFASPSQIPQYNTYDRILDSQPNFLLGVPPPPIPLSISVTGGGNPTQIGFPNSSTSNTYDMLQPYWTVPINETTINYSSDQFAAIQTGPTFGIAPGTTVGTSDGQGSLPGYTLILYPMTTTIAGQIADIGVSVNDLQSSATFSFVGVIFADISATSGNTGATNAPGDLVAMGAPAQAGTIGTATGVAITTPTTLLSTFTTAPTLEANVQYWIGILVTGAGNLPSYLPNEDMHLNIADTNTKGYIGYVAPRFEVDESSESFGVLTSWQILGSSANTLPVDTTTGALTAPTMNAGFVDLQLWADFVDGTVTGAQLETRSYVNTWVTAYDEEGPPSAPVMLDGYDNATWNVGITPPPVQDMGVQRNIIQTNIYRTMASQQGGAVFFLVASLPASATSYVDSLPDDTIANNIEIPSTTWYPPPSDLQGIVSMPNGMLAGFRANEVWFCEPFRPHAWPSGYTMTTDYPVVGLGVIGSSLVACTDTQPNVFTGINPNVMSQSKVQIFEPCRSRGSILATENNVYYVSANGLIKISANATAANVTQGWFTREKWNQLTPQKFIRVAKNVSSYFAFGTTGITNGSPDVSVSQQGYTIEISEVADQQSFTIWPQVGGHRIGFSQLSAPNNINIDNVLCDPWSGVTFLIQGGSLYYYDFTDTAPVITPYIWRSKQFQGPHRENFSAVRVWFDIPPGGPQTPPVNRSFGGPSYTTTPALDFTSGMFGVVRIIADGVYVTERELRYSTELMRIDSSQKYTTWQFEIEGVVDITNFKAATSVKELMTAK